LVGMQPVLTHVPPKRPRSMMATRWPAAAIRTARNGPDCPVPMTIASKSFFTFGGHPRLASLEVDLDVTSRLRAANQHVSFGGSRGSGNSRFERLSKHIGSYGTPPVRRVPPDRRVACLRELQQTVPIGTPRHGRSTWRTRTLTPRAGRPFRRHQDGLQLRLVVRKAALFSSRN
jgi:hypothetical protein